MEFLALISIIRDPRILHTLQWRDIDALACVSHAVSREVGAAIAHWISQVSHHAPAGHNINRYEAEFLHYSSKQEKNTTPICAAIMMHKMRLGKQQIWNPCDIYESKRYFLTRPLLPPHWRVDVSFTIYGTAIAQTISAAAAPIIIFASRTDEQVPHIPSQNITYSVCDFISDLPIARTIVAHADRFSRAKLYLGCPFGRRRMIMDRLKIIVLIEDGQFEREKYIMHMIAHAVTFCTKMIL